MNFSLKIFIVSIALYGCIPSLICLTKADQDFINAVTKNQGGGQGGNATIPGPRDLNAVKKALDAGAKIDTVFADRNNETALHEAINVDDVKLVEFLLQHKANPNIQDIDGNTPAHLAAQYGKVAILDLLVKNGTKLDIKNKEGLKASELLLGFGAVGMSVGNQGGNATYPGKGDIALLKRALELGADINKAFSSVNKSTVLHMAVNTTNEQPAIVEFLLQHKANPNIQDIDGNTPAHLAALSGKKAILDLLVKNGAKLDIKNKAGKTVTDLKNH